jgi:8-oxo-dGTP diphosphatase
LKREIWEEFGIGIDVDKCLGAHVHHYDHGSIKLMAYRAYWISGQIKSTFHAAYQWVALSGLSQFELCAADIPFLEKIAGARIFGQA